VGTAQGGPIPMSDGTYKHDMEGNVVTTKLNEQIGKSIAQAGGGMYVHVDQTNLAQSLLDKEIEKMQKEDISQSMYSEYDEQFVAVALLLFIALVAEFCIMERKNHVFTKYKLFK
jgi:Ca-activated chloride channel family protein